MSGRACGLVVTNMPAPMVAASATAILNDINLSNFASAVPRAVKSRCKTRKCRRCPRIFNRVL